MSRAIVRLGDWRTLAPALRLIREQVFIREQGVPVALEWDEHDAECVHALALMGQRPVGCARLLPDGHVGRMAVMADMRRRRIGSDLLQALMTEAGRRGMRVLRLHAQMHALPFYERAGFVAEGDPFDEAGIAHRLMFCTLAN